MQHTLWHVPFCLSFMNKITDLPISGFLILETDVTQLLEEGAHLQCSGAIPLYLFAFRHLHPYRRPGRFYRFFRHVPPTCVPPTCPPYKANKDWRKPGVLNHMRLLHICSCDSSPFASFYLRERIHVLTLIDIAWMIAQNAWCNGVLRLLVYCNYWLDKYRHLI